MRTKQPQRALSCLAATAAILSCSVSPPDERSTRVMHDAATEPSPPFEDEPGESEEPAPADDCGGTGLCFDWPLPGVDARDWVINNYVDLDPGPGVVDFTGDDKTYDGHLGIDIDVPTFRAMDVGVPVLAAADGVVVASSDVAPDRNVTCVGEANFITLRHANGWTSSYLHIKRRSLAVAVGATVRSGEMLAVVGSSGCSTAPHVHFEVHDASGAVVDPFVARAWRSPPIYATTLGVMDVSVRSSWFSSANEIKDPPPNTTSIRRGSELGIGLSVGGGSIGDTLTLRYLRPDGSVSFAPTEMFTEAYRHSYWYWNYPLGDELGTWTVEVLANKKLARRLMIKQVP